MSSADHQRRWLLPAIGIAILVLGIDIGMRLQGRGDEPAPGPNTRIRKPGTPLRPASVIEKATTARLSAWTLPPVYATRGDEPPLPRMAPAVEALVHEAVARKGDDPTEAMAIYQRAESLAGDPRHAESLRLRRLQILLDTEQIDAARKLAHEIGAKPIRGEARRAVAEILAKLGK